MGSAELEHGQVARLLGGVVGDGGHMTLRQLEAAAVDEATGYRPSRATLWKLHRGERVRISPELVRAVAAGLGVSLRVAQAAFTADYITGDTSA